MLVSEGCIFNIKVFSFHGIYAETQGLISLPLSTYANITQMT